MSNYKRHQHTVKKKNSNVNVMHYKMSTYNVDMLNSYTKDI